ncbi:hypothetical protein ACH5RR_008501 [Cinchona calisaya]|uniref:Uncharacterized protein n=1 Tax=Cinchona calisaya TaxID=153742 RepID=A0ABD3ABX7_9GENT
MRPLGTQENNLSSTPRMETPNTTKPHVSEIEGIRTELNMQTGMGDQRDSVLERLNEGIHSKIVEAQNDIPFDQRPSQPSGNGKGPNNFGNQLENTEKLCEEEGAADKMDVLKEEDANILNNLRRRCWKVNWKLI